MTVLAVGPVKSSSVAIGAASVFVALSALLALMPERGDMRAVRDWALRGTIAPAFAAPAPPQASARGRP